MGDVSDNMAENDVNSSAEFLQSVTLHEKSTTQKNTFGEEKLRLQQLEEGPFFKFWRSCCL
jgi:hypothetical protein